jgi:hypothetical protein
MTKGWISRDKKLDLRDKRLDLRDKRLDLPLKNRVPRRVSRPLNSSLNRFLKQTREAPLWITFSTGHFDGSLRRGRLDRFTADHFLISLKSVRDQFGISSGSVWDQIGHICEN